MPEALDLVDRADQITFEFGLDDDDLDKQELLDIFRVDVISTTESIKKFFDSSSFLARAWLIVCARSLVGWLVGSFVRSLKTEACA